MPFCIRAAGALLCAALLAVSVTTGADASPVTPTFPRSIESLAGYDPQTTCDPTAKPGLVALRSLVMAAYVGTGDSGIVRDCAFGGTSEHKEGRAWDWKVNAYDPAQDAAAKNLFTWLLATDEHGNSYALARRLGVMYMVYNQYIWSAYNAAAGWRPYTGANPHSDHVHISVSWPGADKSTSFWTGSAAGSSPSLPLPPIDAKYAALGGASGVLGASLAPEADAVGGRFHRYRNGSIYWSAATQAHEVHGGILGRWAGLNWERGALGFPVTDELSTPDGIGKYNHFQNGSIYWSPSTPSAEIRGAIFGRWGQLGWERGSLGYPVTNEMATPDGKGRYNHFQRGSVYWTPGTGAQEMRGPVFDAWGRLGWERSGLGYPTSGESVTPDGRGRYNAFQFGTIYWSATTGAHEVRGAILGAWGRTGWERGPLGYPTSDEYDIPGGRASDFQGGRITWSGSTGATAVSRR